jgi:hypothetical protein
VKLRFSAAASLDRDRRTAAAMSRMLSRSADRIRSDMTPEVAEARQNRRVMRRTGAYGSGGAGGAGGFGDIQFATGRPRDPLFYWRQNNLPYDFSQNEELAKVRAFCNTPDAPVWMGDYSFKPIGEIQPGEEVIGWIWTRGPEQLHGRKRLVRTKVLAVARRWAPEVVRVTMKSGRVLKCTPDHMWANARYSPAWKGQANRDGWKQPEFIPAVTKARNARFTRIIDPTPELVDDKQRRAADWLSGCYDGEGCGERIGQYEGRNDPVRARIMDYLDILGLPHTEQKFTISIAHPGRRGGAGAHQDLVNFLNWCDPVRRVSKQIDKRLLNRPSAGYDEVESVESLGAGWVISMQTETGNYTAWGFASKNCRLLYQTDPIIGSCVDIFSKFPTMGDHLECKDSRLEDFYGSLFFDEDHLDYEEFTVDIGREYWTSGEAWPFATFNEDLGIWDDEELLNPDDIKVERSPFLKEPRYFIKLPWTIRQILQTRQPQWEYSRLVQEFPELTAYTSENTFMPVSGILLRQLKFRGDTFNVRGVPLLTRAMRSMLQKEMLNTALDSIADRLYTPLILCKLGASATDLGTSQPWIPTDDDLENFELALDAALAGDFRALIYNFAVEMLPVLGRENMPDLTPDFERIEDSILQVFGLSRTFLMGAQSGQTYAADALNKELVTMLMAKYQKFQARHFRQRAMVVAEAQEHYDYREHGGKRYVIMEEILETDEETGEKHLVEQPKLLVPERRFKVLNLKDEDVTRQFVEALRESGVPISQRTRVRGLDIDLEEEEERSADETVRQAVAEQEARKRTYIALRDKGLPVPPELANDFAALAQVAPGPSPLAIGSGTIPRLGNEPNGPLMALAPGPDDEEAMEAQAEEEGAAPPEGEGPQDEEESEAGEGGPPGKPDQRPDESDEERKGMPSQAALFRRTAAVRERGRARERKPHERERHLTEVLRPDGTQQQVNIWFTEDAPAGYRDPVVVGTRLKRTAGDGELIEHPGFDYLDPAL